MSEIVSVTNTEQSIELKSNKSDITAMLLKGSLGAVPVFGPILAEIVSIVIPNQKTERIKVFAEILDYKLKLIEQEISEQKLKSKEFTDLFESSLIQASRALSKDRLEYLASLLKNSLTDDELEIIGKKKLLNLLNELNDTEIIWLKYYYIAKHIHSQEVADFYRTHEPVLKPIKIALGGGTSQEDVDRKALQVTYQRNLLNLGLIAERFNSIKKGEIPEYDNNTGKIKSSGFNCTNLGKLLLRYIDLLETETH